MYVGDKRIMEDYLVYFILGGCLGFIPSFAISNRHLRWFAMSVSFVFAIIPVLLAAPIPTSLISVFFSILFAYMASSSRLQEVIIDSLHDALS